MNFKDAMEAMQKGFKVTRQPWAKSCYFLADGNNVKSFQPLIKIYAYNEDIMISSGWLVEGMQDEMMFYDIIPYLKNGKTAKLKDWNEAYIKYDAINKYIVCYAMEEFPYVPDFESFTASDWVILGE